jgi:3-oxoisoapionate decarboxylase
MMTRREALAVAASAPAWLSVSPAQGGAKPLRNLGGAPTAFALRSRANRPTFDMLEHCHALGMGAVQTRLPANDPETVRKFRQRLEGYDMRAILAAPLPKQPGDVDAFEAAVAAAKEAGAFAMHTALTQRRYEEFKTFDAFKAHFDQCQTSVTLAEPVLRKHRIKLAIENHKGWRAAEHAAWITRVSSEWVGVCFDFGNNVALCEDPMDTLRLLAPYTIFCHMKDMGVDSYDDGFLLSEVVYGNGFLDVPAIVKTLQQRDPTMIFALEMITRDPLHIPVFTDQYWATFDDASSALPGRDLARVLSIVRKNPPKKPLPRISGLAAEAQVKLEDDLNQQCIDYCRRALTL